MGFVMRALLLLPKASQRNVITDSVHRVQAQGEMRGHRVCAFYQHSIFLLHRPSLTSDRWSSFGFSVSWHLKIYIYTFFIYTHTYTHTYTDTPAHAHPYGCVRVCVCGLKRGKRWWRGGGAALGIFKAPVIWPAMLSELVLQVTSSKTTWLKSLLKPPRVHVNLC